MRVQSDLKDYDRFFLRKMLGWICKEVEVNFKKINVVEFKSDAKGRDWRCNYKKGSRKHFVICLDLAQMKFPYEYGSKKIRLSDAVELMVYFSAWMISNSGSMTARSAAKITLESFRKNRDKLFYDWTKPEKVREVKPALTLVEKRKQRVEEVLKVWEKKLALAKTKVAKYKRKLQYYNR